MVDLNSVLEAIDKRKRKVLLAAESSLGSQQFKAFRRLFLDEFGNSGLTKDLQGLDRMDRQNARYGSGRPIQQRKEEDNE